MTAPFWSVEIVHDERHAVYCDASGSVLSRWKYVPRVGFLLRRRARGGPGWVRPKAGVPERVEELLAPMVTT